MNAPSAPSRQARPNDVSLLDVEDPRPRQIALLVALLVHGFLLVVSLPSFGRRAPEAPARPGRPVRLAPLPVPEIPRPRRPRPAETEALALRTVPVPDPAAEVPEPIREPAATAAPLPIAPAGIAPVLPDPTPPPAATPSTPGVDRGVSQPVLIESTRVMPRYPGAARAVRVEGTVVLRGVVRRDGTVDSLEVLRSPAPGLGFETAAIAAVRQWRFHPAVLDGRTVDAYLTIIVEFVMD
jgi:protein TonB